MACAPKELGLFLCYLFSSRDLKKGGGWGGVCLEKAVNWIFTEVWPQSGDMCSQRRIILISARR